MLRILGATLRNFLSIGNVTQTLDLSIDGLTLILGENLDIGGANSRNGVGKTTLLQAISYAIFGKPLTKIRLDNLCNNINNKAMLVTIDFECRGKTYRIERGRKPSVLRFYKDGVQLKEFDESQGETKHTQTEIERLIGMSYVMFRHIVALNTLTTPFLREEAGVQRDLIEELFGIMQLSQRAESLKALIDATKEQTRDAEATVKADGEANARITQAIDRAKDEALTWQVAQQRRVTDLTAQVKSLHQIDIEHELAVFDQIDQWHQEQQKIKQHEQQITALTQEIARLQAEIVRYETEIKAGDRGEIDRLTRQAQQYWDEAEQDIQPQVDRLRSEIARRQRDAATKHDEANRLATELLRVREQLVHPDMHRCTTCNQELAGTDHLAVVMANLTEQADHLEKTIVGLLSDQDKALYDATLVEAEIVRVQTTDQQHRADLRAKALAIQGEVEQVGVQRDAKQADTERRVHDLQLTIESLTTIRQTLRDEMLSPCAAPVSTYRDRDAVWQVRQQRAALEQRLAIEVAKANPITTKIEGLQSTLTEIDYATLNELTLRFKHETFLYKLLTAKDSFIRKKIIDQNLIYLNKRLTHYLERLALPHEVVFQPDLTVEIMLLGRDYDFEQLSRGEMNRVILATALSFRDVWENLNMPLNLMFVDEMLDQGTDGAGVEAALDILTGMSAERHKTVFLVSHREELRDHIDHVMVVRKENQFTSFLW